MLADFATVVEQGTRDEALLAGIAWERMLRRYIRLEIDEIDRQNIRFQAIGRTDSLAENVRREINRATERTSRNTGMVLSVALNYGGRAEIVDAAREAFKQLVAEGKNID